MKKRLVSLIPAFVAGLFVIQPLMDVLSFWLEKLEISNTLTLVLRMAVLGATVLLAFTVSGRKRVYWIGAGICIALFAAHVWACSRVGYSDLVGDFTNYIRVVQMPVTVLCLITLMRQHEKGYEAMQVGLSLALLVMLVVEVLSIVTGTDNSAYANGHGILGWFNNSNSQSANLTALVPISLAWQLRWKKRQPLLFWDLGVR